MGDKTLAMKILDGQDIGYEVYYYSELERDASRIASDLGVSAGEVYKTLVAVRRVGKPLLIMLPSNRQLDLKGVAKAVGDKKIRLASHNQAEILTGLKVGGISALALLNRGFDVYLDRSALKHHHVYVSAGLRGIDIRLPVSELVRMTKAHIVDAALEL